jgi:hypothetical protein
MQAYEDRQDAWVKQIGDEVNIAELLPGEDYFICYTNLPGRITERGHGILIKGTYRYMKLVTDTKGIHWRPVFKGLSVFPSNPGISHAYEIDHGWKIYYTPESAAFVRGLARKRAEHRMRTKNAKLGISFKEELLEAVWEPARAERTGLLKMAYDEIDAEGF